MCFFDDCSFTFTLNVWSNVTYRTRKLREVHFHPWVSRTIWASVVNGTGIRVGVEGKSKRGRGNKGPVGPLNRGNSWRHQWKGIALW